MAAVVVPVAVTVKTASLPSTTVGVSVTATRTASLGAMVAVAEAVVSWGVKPVPPPAGLRRVTVKFSNPSPILSS